MKTKTYWELKSFLRHHKDVDKKTRNKILDRVEKIASESYRKGDESGWSSEIDRSPDII